MASHAAASPIMHLPTSRLRSTSHPGMPVKRRLSFLLVEKDRDGLSPRKILLESAKHNVVTAYSLSEGLAMFRRFVNVDAIAIDARFGDEVCSEMVRQVKSTHPQLNIVAFMSTSDHEC